MLEGTEREVLELLLERPRSPTEVAEELGVSVQTASRNLKQLVEREFAERTREGEGRGYKRYRTREFAQVFAGYDGELFEQTVELTETHRAMLSILKVPQSVFHPVLLSYLFSAMNRQGFGVTAVVVYGSVARGQAEAGSDIDILTIYASEDASSVVEPGKVVDTTTVWDGGFIAPDANRVVSETWYSVGELCDALDAGSQFLGNVLDEGIVLYDPEGVIRDARRERAGERVPQ